MFVQLILFVPQPFTKLRKHQRRNPKALTIGGSFALPAHTEKKQIILTIANTTIKIAHAIGTINVQQRIRPTNTASMFSTVNLSA